MSSEVQVLDMILNAFPGGAISYGGPSLGPFLTTGKIFYVSSGTGNNAFDGLSIDHPVATIDYAVGLCTASKGDVIVVMPGHTETITAAAGIALDVIGITVIGLGRGSNRPTINYTTATTATMTISAANITVANILFTGGIDALVSPISISAADVTLINIETKDVTGQATDFILTTAAANRLVIDGWVHDGATAAGANAALAIVGGDRIEVKNFSIDGNFAVGAIDIRTTATTDIRIHDGSVRTRNAADIAIVDTITASTGFIGPNLNLQLTDNAANITEATTGATFVYFQPINVVNLAGESSMQTNITASTDA